MALLRQPSVMDTIQVRYTIHRSWLRSWFCAHRQYVGYVRIDHRAGPGNFADNYKGMVCVNCGKVLCERML